MNFCIIEKKDKDLFVIYDTENKGACCCTGYTIKQLMEKHNVQGATMKNGRLNVIEVDLDGKPREKKAPNCCDDLTKRSASTIEKGLDEKHYPRVKQNRSGAKGLFASGDVFFWNGVNDKGEKIQQFCTFMENGSMCFPNGKYMDALTVNKNIKAFTPITDTMSQTVKDFVKHSGKLKADIIDCERQIVLCQKRIETLQAHKTALETEFKSNYKCLMDVRKKEKEEARILELEKVIKGNEIEKMDFYSGPQVDVPRAIAIIKKTKRKIVYTYGLKFRNPTTYEVPISKEKAIDIVRENGLLSIDFKKDIIDIQEVSGSDMW